MANWGFGFNTEPDEYGESKEYFIQSKDGKYYASCFGSPGWNRMIYKDEPLEGSILDEVLLQMYTLI